MTNNQVTLKLDDCRRLTGKNLLSDHPGAIIDSFVSGIDKDLVVDSWQKFTRVFLSLVGWEDQHIYHRIFEDGITLAISAPVDGLYSACELIEESWAYTCEHLAEGSEYAKSFKNFMQSCEHLKAEIANEANPLLLTLIEHADQHNINYLIDDDEFSLGYGTYSQAWPIHQLPQPNSINWQRYKSIPVAYVTGTNGKSTSVRIISKMFSEAGYCAGSTSTDFIKVGNEILDYGDYSGPSGARMLLRHPKTEIAILEVARGGILRRGLPVDCVDSALITNVAEDHLGQYGINNVTDLTQAKAVVAKALDTNPALKAKTLSLNADDENLIRVAKTLRAQLCWFSLDETNPVIVKHQQSGGAVCFVHNGALIYINQAGVESNIIAVNDIPMTLKGAAVHNIHNALGAICLAKSLNIDDTAIRNALRQFSSNIDDNPGRGNQFEVKGAHLILDYAHNAHSTLAMATTLKNMPSKRKFLMLSHPGDRSDSEIINSTNIALTMKPDFIVIADIAEYLRGREAGEVPKLIEKTATAANMNEKNIFIVDTPYQGVKLITDMLESDDLALLMVLADRSKIIEHLRKKS